MSRFPKSPALAKVAALQAAVDDLDAQIAGMERDLAALGEQKTAVESRLSEVQANAPVAPPEFDDALIEAHAADPAAEVDPAAIEAAVQQHAAYEDAKRAHASSVAVQGRLTTQAVGRLDRKATELVADIAQARDDRRDAYVNLLSGAHAYLLDRFTEEFAKLRADFINPMIAIQNVKNAQHEPLINRRAHQSIDDSSRIRVSGRRPNGTHGETDLLDFSTAAARKIDMPAALAALRDDLRAARPAAR